MILKVLTGGWGGAAGYKENAETVSREGRQSGLGAREE